jgi:hypothetical protein
MLYMILYVINEPNKVLLEMNVERDLYCGHMNQIHRLDINTKCNRNSFQSSVYYTHGAYMQIFPTFSVHSL